MSGPARTPIADRFWPKVDKTGTCWNWTAATSHGYGRFMVSSGIQAQAHRVSFELTNGPIPDGLVVDHMCHNRSCVNPSHLRLATSIENSQNRKGGTVRNTSGHRGVTWHAKAEKWQAKAMKGGRYHSGGLHHDIADAVEAAEALRERLYGEKVSA